MEPTSERGASRRAGKLKQTLAESAQAIRSEGDQSVTEKGRGGGESAVQPRSDDADEHAAHDREASRERCSDVGGARKAVDVPVG